MLACAVGGYIFVYLLLRLFLTPPKTHPPKLEPPHLETGGPNSEAKSGPRDQGTLPWHQILGVSPSASKSEIEKAYRAKIRLYHPDRVVGLGPELLAIAEQMSKEINNAYGSAIKQSHP
jgi:hypothetical protein